MIQESLIVRRHVRRFILQPATFASFYPLSSRPPKSHRIISFADPHPLTLFKSYRSKNRGRGPLRSFNITTHLSTCRINNTSKSVSKQRTLSSFRINTYEKQGRGWPVIVSQTPDEGCLSRVRRGGGVKDLSRPANYSLESGLGRSRRRIDRCAGSFLQGMNRIDRQVFKALDQTAGPADLYPFDLGRRPEAEVRAHIAIGNVAGTAANFVDEHPRPGFHCDLRADTITVGFAAARSRGIRRSNCPERDTMIRIADVVHQQHRRRIHVADHCGHPAVIPQIADRQSASRTYRGNPRPRIRRNIRKRSVAVVAIKNLRLLEIAAKMLAVHLRVDMAVDQQQIGPAIIVHVKKHDAPAAVLRVESE